MFKTTRNTCISISTFLVGILIGASALAYLLVAKVPMPIMPHLLSASSSLAPACIAVLIASLIWKPLQQAVTPILGLAGFTIPFDFAFACLLGLFDDVALRGIVVILFLASALMLISLYGAMPRGRKKDVAPTHQIKTLKGHHSTTGAGQ